MRSARSIAWVLLRNEVRLAWRGINPRSAAASVTVGGILLAGGQVFALVFILGLGRGGISLLAEQRTWAFLASLMFGVAFLNAVKVVTERNDADLLLPAPINPGLILLTRWAGIAVAGMVPAVFLAPLVNAAALLLSPGYFCSYGVILLLAGAAAAAGIMGALGIIRVFGIRRGRTVAQILGATVGAVVYLGFQLTRFFLDLPSGFTRFVSRITENPLTFSLAQAGRGGALHLGIIVAGVAVVVGVTLYFFGPVLLVGYQEVVPDSRARKGNDRIHGMDTRLWQAGYRKDVRLILRDPLLFSQTLPTVLYLFPGLILLARTAPTAALAAGSVVVAGQISNILAAMLASGEEAWDLMRMSPAPMRSIVFSKLAAATTAPLSFCLLCSLALVYFDRPLAAIFSILASIMVDVAGGWLEISDIHPSPRSEIVRRQHHGSQRILYNIITITVSLLGASSAGFAASDHWLGAISLLLVTAAASGAVVASNPIRAFPTTG
jgi:ABC-2 type transport system permease protein